MKLLALKINSRGNQGWESERISFGEITQIWGENGSGKTPIIQATVFGLGYPVIFRDDVKAKCRSVSLWLKANNVDYVFEREITDGFAISVTSVSIKQSFSDERAFSEFLFSLIGLQPVNLLDSSSRKVSAYAATVLPLFFLDQDTGYSDIYRPATSFIKDQFQEMVRFIFRFSQKHLFESAKDLVELKRRRETLDELVAGQRSVFDRLYAARPSGLTEGQLSAQLAEGQQRLTNLRDSRGSNVEVTAAFDSAIYELRKSLDEVDREDADLRLRVSSFSRIEQELQTEINTLSLNERAKRLFESFDTICANVNCGLFTTSSETYGKNLLYLKDQAKDLATSANAAKERRAVLAETRGHSAKQLDLLKSKREKSVADQGISGFVDVIRATTESIVTLEQELASVQQIKAVSLRIDNAMAERTQLSQKIDDIENVGRKSDQNLIGLRSDLRQLTVKWLEVLGTENVDRNIFIENDLRFKFGNESIQAFKGSTKVRVVLAVHAALFEAYLRKPGMKLGFLIFDTPNQQEIKVDDLRNFMHRLKALCSEFGAQVIFASKDYRYEVDAATDVFVEPTFPGPQHPMYFGMLTRAN
jgi:hypothetical protein